MIYYGLAAIFPLLCWAFHDWWIKRNKLSEEKQKKFKMGMIVTAILPIFLLFVLRYKYIGSDTIGYVRFFQSEIRSYSFKELLVSNDFRFETGFCLYVKIVSLFTSNYTVFFLVNAIVIFGTLLRFSLKYTQNPYVFFFLFIALGTYQFMETGLRQALAITICLWAIDFVKSKKLIPFLLTVWIAYYFHKSALIFLAVYPFCALKKYDWIILVYILLTAVFMVGFATFQDTFNRWLGYGYEIEETGNGGIFTILVTVFFLFSFYILYDKKDDEKPMMLFMHLSLLTVLFWFLRLISRTAERISYYYISGLYIYFSQATQYNKDKLSTFLKLLLIFVGLGLFVYRNIGVEYLFFWQGA